MSSSNTESDNAESISNRKAIDSCCDFDVEIEVSTIDIASQECSGSIIAPTIVLTAAHCVQSGATYKIVEYDAQRIPQLRDVAQVGGANTRYQAFLRPLQASDPRRRLTKRPAIESMASRMATNGKVTRHDGYGRGGAAP